ncbi:DUF6314 family protein [uncultured Gimesia sp.]|uniref:DUF6314 family protein n=1 Tax=uncultured Gimesia sp. TaxID=1678688 RepID=UPI002619DAA1|nr:DUF6314 family protein [uncultured Gimesia sp.]
MVTNFDLHTLWNRLTEVESLQFTAQSFDSGSGWNGTGKGSVEVETVDSVTMLYHETGCWSPHEGTELQFTNVFRWTSLLDQNLLRLEHLRFGKTNPVYLFELQQTGKIRWDSVEPHVCSDDLYTAMLECQHDRLDLDWTVKGATKNEKISYLYS